MSNLADQFLKRVRPLWRDQQGITGLETAIVLIAFVVVSSVFAFAALSTGLFTTDRAKETIHAGLKQARSTLEMRGSLLAVATAGTSGTVTQLRFQVANAAAGEAIDLTPGRTVIKYTDANQTDNLVTAAAFTATLVGAGDSDSLLESGEIFEILIPPTGTTLTSVLGTALGTTTQFSLEVIPPTGATLYLQRTTPVAFSLLENLN
jgi:flagellin FlaB